MTHTPQSQPTSRTKLVPVFALVAAFASPALAETCGDSVSDWTFNYAGRPVAGEPGALAAPELKGTVVPGVYLKTRRVDCTPDILGNTGSHGSSNIGGNAVANDAATAVPDNKPALLGSRVHAVVTDWLGYVMDWDRLTISTFHIAWPEIELTGSVQDSVGAATVGGGVEARLGGNFRGRLEAFQLSNAGESQLDALDTVHAAGIGPLEIDPGSIVVRLGGAYDLE